MVPRNARGQPAARRPDVELTWGRRMIRSELIQKIAEENPHLYQRDVERIVGVVFDQIVEDITAFLAGDPVRVVAP